MTLTINTVDGRFWRVEIPQAGVNAIIQCISDEQMFQITNDKTDIYIIPRNVASVVVSKEHHEWLDKYYLKEVSRTK